MSQTPDSRSSSQDPPVEGLFHLATELEAGPEGARRRLEEKGKLLLSAGVVFPSGDRWRDEGMAIAMAAGDECPDDEPPGDYGNLPVTPSGATEGSTARVGW
jgi:hypothetical protein